MNRARIIDFATAACLALPALVLAAGASAAEHTWTPSRMAVWHALVEELEIQELHQRLSRRHRPRDVAIRGVTAIPMTGAEAQAVPAQTVVVRDGRIVALGDDSLVATPPGASGIDVIEVVDGKGKYLLPGLVDMHAHNLDSNAQHLLNLAAGVTSVRDLDGFPWMLRMRGQVAGGALLAPSMYVSGTILNGNDFGGYAHAVTDEAEARAAVRAQAAAGYDFVKVHNSLSLPRLRAIVETAREQGLDTVGHIPVGVTVAQAVALGMRTFEHFKGYIVDSTLTLSEEDYVAASRGAKVWNTPTFVTYRAHLRGEEAAAALRAPEMRYVSPRLRRRWQGFVAMAPDEVTRLRQGILPMSRRIFGELRTLRNSEFLAGTDSGSMEMLVPGFALHEELAIFRRLGMSPYEALRTATVNPAAAMRREGEFGVIALGARADLVLLDDDPLAAETPLSMAPIRGVMVRGIWLDRDDLDAILAGLEAVYARSAARLDEGADTVPAAALTDYRRRVEALAGDGFVLRDHQLELAATMFDHLGRPADAAALRAHKTDPDGGFAFLRFE